jgi:hypothetical protein
LTCALGTNRASRLSALNAGMLRRSLKDPKHIPAFDFASLGPVAVFLGAIPAAWRSGDFDVKSTSAAPRRTACDPHRIGTATHRHVVGSGRQLRDHGADSRQKNLAPGHARFSPLPQSQPAAIQGTGIRDRIPRDGRALNPVLLGVKALLAIGDAPVKLLERVFISDLLGLRRRRNRFMEYRYFKLTPP